MCRNGDISIVNIYVINNIYKQHFGYFNMTKVTKLFAEFKREGLLDDRSQYDTEDLMSTYHLNKKEGRMLYLKLRKWRKSAEKKSKKKNLVDSKNGVLVINE